MVECYFYTQKLEVNNMWLWIFLFSLIMLPITAFVIGVSIIILLQCIKYGLNKGGGRDG